MKKKLNSGREIAQYIEECSENVVDFQMIEEYFFNCEAELREVNIDSLLSDSDDHNLEDLEKQNKYNKMDIKDAPPIVVEQGIIKDGHHRVRSAKHQNKQTIMAYVVMEK